MSAILDTKLRRSFSFIIHNLSQVKSISEYLVQEGAITMRDYENIITVSGLTDKASQLMTVLNKKSTRAKTCFMDALSLFSEHHIKEAILHCPIPNTGLSSG